MLPVQRCGFDEIPNEKLWEIMEYLQEDAQGNFALTCQRAWAIGQALHCQNHHKQLQGPLKLMHTYIGKINQLMEGLCSDVGEAGRLQSIKQKLEKIAQAIPTETAPCFSIEKALIIVAMKSFNQNVTRRTRERESWWDYCQTLPEAQSEHNAFLGVLGEFYGLYTPYDFSKHAITYVISKEDLQKYRCTVLRIAYRSEPNNGTPEDVERHHALVLQGVAEAFCRLRDFTSAEKTVAKIAVADIKARTLVEMEGLGWSEKR